MTKTIPKINPAVLRAMETLSRECNLELALRAKSGTGSAPGWTEYALKLWEAEHQASIERMRKSVDEFSKTVESYYEVVGSPGSSRTAYKLDDFHVIKIGIGVLASGDFGKFLDNKFKDVFAIGKAQNKAEFAAMEKKCTDRSLVAEVVDHAPDFKWIISERAKKITQVTFEMNTGIEWSQFNTLLWSCKDGKLTTDYLKRRYVHIISNPWFIKVAKAISKCHWVPADLIEIYQWGYIEGKGIVLLDYGFTKTVGKKYYNWT